MSDDLVRLRPTQPTTEPAANGATAGNNEDFYVYLMARRDALANELRTVEHLLVESGRITRRLCALGRMR